MPVSKPLVVLGLLGTNLDGGKDVSRWERWRPSVALCQHPDLLVSRFELLLQAGRYGALGEIVETDIRAVSPETVVRRHGVEFTDPWAFEEVYAALHDFARNYPFAPEKEDYLIHITTGTHVAQICLFLLTEARYLPAKLLQSEPPPRHKPHEPGAFSIIDLDLSRYDRIATRFHREREESLSFLKGGIPTRNAAFNRLIERIEQVAIRSAEPILLLGPTGAGKTRLARRIFDLKQSRRQVAGEFVELNCATLRGDAAMSALFGHKKGAFTGALRDRPGLLRAADGGVLFLDEIGELGPDEQAMLLRALEEKRFLPLGADREASSDFQLLAGTNRDLHAAVAAGTFREDLLARLNVWTFRLPGLRERPEDVEPNLDYELAEFARRGGDAVRLNAEARKRFLGFAAAPDAAWRGNFRDLNAAVRRMGTLATGGRITLDGVEEEIARLESGWAPAADEADGADDAGALATVLGPERLAALDPFDRVQLAHVVAVCRRVGSLSAAGRELFAISRQKKSAPNDADRLRKYLTRFGLDWKQL